MSTIAYVMLWFVAGILAYPYLKSFYFSIPNTIAQYIHSMPQKSMEIKFYPQPLNWAVKFL